MSDDLHKLAFEGVYLLAGPGEQEPASEAQLAKLTTEQRDRVLKMATRRLAFQILYQLDQSTKPAPESIHKTLEDVDGLGPIAISNTESLIRGAFESRTTADKEFEELAPEWPTHRLAAVDRAILRLAHFEMTSGRTPPTIAVNEAIELAKHYSTEKAPAFINGLLDKVLKRLESKSTTENTEIHGENN